jgi:chromosome partitioning protein
MSGFRWKRGKSAPTLERRMTVVVIANPKGGVGKTTLATNVAGYFASRGRAVMLGDADRQGSSQLWLGLRPPSAPVISSWEASGDNLVKPPKGTTHVVLDTPGGLHGKRLGEVVKLADKIIVPLQPSVFDIFATRDFLDQLADYRRLGKIKVGIVGMRVDARTIAADKLEEFVAGLGFPVLGMVRDTQNYIHLAARGLSLFDVTPGRVEKDRAQWDNICQWLDQK